MMEKMKQERLVPVRDTGESVAYLGVELPKAKNTENAPKKEQFEGRYINDRYSLEMQKKIAVSWKQGDPVLDEGGTSLGKTTRILKMSADLGYEVHYVNLNGATDVEDLMGRYVPNHERRNATDPEYVFADGKVTSGLRQEEGKIKVVLLDEYGAAAPNIVIRLHEVLDALERGGEVVLAEDASEKLVVDKDKTKIIALTNPPGRGYLQREPLDPAQLRRWVYLKEPNELPEETLSHATRALFGLEHSTQAVPEEAYLFGNERALTPEQLKEIPGIDVITKKYLEFHKGAKDLLAKRHIAADQPQRFSFDDRMEPRRVRDFITSFYRGDITETMQTALSYYYAGKLLDQADKDQLEELIRLVEYTPPAGASSRKGLEGTEDSSGQEGRDTITEDSREGTSLADAERILGKESILGPKDVEQVFGIKLDKIPAIPFSPKELETAKRLGQQLILQVDTMTIEEKGGILRGSKKSFVPLTLENLKKQLTKAHDDKPMLYPQNWYESDDFFKNEKPRTGWRLTSKDIVPNSTSKNYLEQTDVLVAHLRNEVFKGMPMPKEYADAISEFDHAHSKIASLMDSDWQKASQALADLSITKLTHESPIEVMYRLALNDLARNQKPLPSIYTWTGGRASGGGLVSVGDFDDDGARVHNDGPRSSLGLLGVCLSRS